MQSGEIIPGTGNSMCKSHEVELILVCLRNRPVLLLNLQSISHLPLGFIIFSLDHNPGYYFLILVSMPYN